MAVFEAYIALFGVKIGIIEDHFRPELVTSIHLMICIAVFALKKAFTAPK